ncbi:MULTISPECIES: cupin domain-containing protein [unclassified Paludibacterium]|uniref:cupin domain-containing protein n=1 Tax=unclassified Paludibacterium TaxID=2618429 RepID=UPI001C04075D|nr:cupin domain-containing protein [Paludibacterium sp. B53371]BEV73072.1 cupin domain-containing protein [Paludibacterium sp. THUN1379]
MKQTKDIIVFQRHAVAEESFTAADDRRIEGACQQQVAHHYSDPSGQFHAGIWRGGLGSWRVKYSEHEFCTLLEGHVRLTDHLGHSIELHAGDHFVIPAGFEGVWQVLQPACKTYAVFESSNK